MNYMWKTKQLETKIDKIQQQKNEHTENCYSKTFKM